MSNVRAPVVAAFGGGTDFFRAWGSTDAEGATRLIDICLDAGLNMFESGDWLIPTIDGEHPHLTKPPVTYWAIAASFARLLAGKLIALHLPPEHAPQEDPSEKE